MVKWHSCSEDVEVRKFELDIESVIVDSVRLSLNGTLEGSVEQEMKEKETLAKKKEHLADELQELLALVKAKEKEIDENDLQIKAVETRINSVVSGYKELQTSMDKIFNDVQTGLSQIDMETEALSTKKKETDKFMASEKESAAKLRDLVSVSADEAYEYEKVIKLRKTLMSYVSKTREERAKLVNIEEKLSEEVQRLQEEVSSTRESIKVFLFFLFFFLSCCNIIYYESCFTSIYVLTRLYTRQSIYLQLLIHKVRIIRKKCLFSLVVQVRTGYLLTLVP